LSEFRTAIEPYRPIDLFVYGPRDLYRPSETIVIDGLLRNQDGQMTAALAITANVIRPDGRVVHEFQWKGSRLNHYHYEYNLPADAITGKWRITFKQAAVFLKEYRFVVADFLPERMKLQVTNPKNQTNILGTSDTPIIQLKGDFLYGAPAAGVRSDAMIHIRPARKLFKEKWPGYEFGDATDNFKQSYATDSIVLDKNGMGKLKVQNEWKEILSPLWLTANASVYDSGGRPVVRNKSWQIWPAEPLVGIRSLSLGDQIKNNSTARFEIIVVNKQGERIKAKGLKAVVIKEHGEYYWEYRHETWQWHHTSQFYPVDQFNVDVPENGAAIVNVPVKWGGYRLEIKHPTTGL
ncbi:MAG: alpha-2-macroglobulin family protein, partial [Desulfobacteraceae bacterium]|nr:alpha-2-macroglobulin family protein [Desulfobacteraceae bacterium]